MTETSIVTVDDRSDLPEAEVPRWQLLRAGIQNVWEYDDHRFVFHRGRLILRGRNESGKTKALEVLLPFLLDADLSPQRLDPFGSKARQMRWNLLNEGNPDESVHIGYVWLEQGRLVDGSTEYCTIGAGLRAQRSGTGVDVWYFVTPLRSDRDLYLIDSSRVPLTRGRLEQALDGSGTVYDRKSDYRRAVNRQFFGMAEEQYDALVEALLQLRRPQLSKRLQPSELSGILSASLPPLDPAVVSQLAEAFDRLDQHRTVREELSRTSSAVRGFMDVYRRYLSTLAKAQAVGVIDAADDLGRIGEELAVNEGRLLESIASRDELAEVVRELEREARGLDERIETLRSSEAYRAVQELAGAERLAEALDNRANDAEGRLEAEEARLGQLRGRLRSTEEALEPKQQSFGVFGAEAARRAVEAGLLQEHRSIQDQVEAGDLAAARGTLESVLAARREAFKALTREEERTHEASEKARRAEERAQDRSEAARAAVEALEKATQAEEAAIASFGADVEAWLESSSELDLDDETRMGLLDAEPEEAPQLLRRAAATKVATLEEVSSGLKVKAGIFTKQLKELRGERELVESSTYSPPAPPPWRTPRREDRPGAPLYLLCDLDLEDERAPGNLEAALEASGLLDAWVTPSGSIECPIAGDALLEACPRSGATLADVLRPTPMGGVSFQVIERILRSVSLSRDDEDDGAPCWVSVTGAWRLGPLRGAATKSSPSYLGATARERERERRLVELDGLLKEAEAHQTDLSAQLERLAVRRRILEGELDRFPHLRAVIEAGSRRSVAAELREQRRHDVAGAKAKETRERELLRERTLTRDEVAARYGLRSWAGGLDRLRQLTLEYESSARELILGAADLAGRLAMRGELRNDVDTLIDSVEEARIESREARDEAERAGERTTALREAMGSSLEELVTTLRQAEARRVEVRKRIERSRRDKGRADHQAGERAGAVEAARGVVALAEARCREVVNELRELAQGGLLGAIGLERSSDASSWNVAEAVEAARNIELALRPIESSREARERAENQVVQRHSELGRSLGAELRVMPRREGGVLRYDATHNGRPRRLWEVADELEADVAARDRLLGEEERQLFESFLSGEIHAHLRSRLREAHRLVDRMNEQLERCPTASGMRLRLRWAPSDDAPAGTVQAIDLLLRSGGLLSDSDRGALRRFLEQRFDEAHSQDGSGSLHERMMVSLDYRLWFLFTVEFRPRDGSWRKLTRKAHSAGSGGQKAVMLHLPLFAAASAFFESASPGSPRLIVLDEAFAGIDRLIRGQLMGLLRDLDLDFVMTSYDEWGFYEELDGVATYHLTRRPGRRGVSTDRFIWDGRASREVAA
jgi:uncharacterized protein (TIGR02680 family)